jgi:hypothetical protein
MFWSVEIDWLFTGASATALTAISTSSPGSSGHLRARLERSRLCRVNRQQVKFAPAAPAAKSFAKSDDRVVSAEPSTPLALSMITGQTRRRRPLADPTGAFVDLMLTAIDTVATFEPAAPSLTLNVKLLAL